MTAVNSDAWKSIIATKKQAHGWDAAIPDQSLIDEIVDELHNYCPSKQNLCRYKISVLKNFNDEERKLKLYKSAPRSPQDPDTNYNPQLLAPYVFVFFNDEKTDVDETTKEASIMDIGIASAFVCYSAVSKGLDIGFCACSGEDMRELFDGERPWLLMGVGYKNTAKPARWDRADPANIWHCPVKNETLYSHGRPFTEKPQRDTYIKFMD